ncbi:MAG: hypothetical protein ABSA97_13110 [Verrucomicrobiia bacterium]
MRSWVLRQKVNGQQLPDRYTVTREYRFQTKPGMYRQKGKDPVSSPSWIDAAKAGTVDTDGFVRALTHPFQKRGYNGQQHSDNSLENAGLNLILGRRTRT